MCPLESQKSGIVREPTLSSSEPAICLTTFNVALTILRLTNIRSYQVRKCPIIHGQSFYLLFSNNNISIAACFCLPAEALGSCSTALTTAVRISLCLLLQSPNTGLRFSVNLSIRSYESYTTNWRRLVNALVKCNIHRYRMSMLRALHGQVLSPVEAASPYTDKSKSSSSSSFSMTSTSNLSNR
jgi:hypothetical protein